MLEYNLMIMSFQQTIEIFKIQAEEANRREKEVERQRNEVSLLVS